MQNAALHGENKACAAKTTGLPNTCYDPLMLSKEQYGRNNQGPSVLHDLTSFWVDG